MTLAELIEALEKATGPSRELDAEIMLVTEWSEVWVTDTITGPEYIWQRGGIRTGSPGRFTDSIDAARTLVPEGMCWNLDSVGVAYVHKAGVKAIHHYGEHFDHCLPIALVIAALKARTDKPNP